MRRANVVRRKLEYLRQELKRNEAGFYTFKFIPTTTTEPKIVYDRVVEALEWVLGEREEL